MAEPYRFDFESDQQYQTRIGGDSASPANTNQPTQPTPTTTEPVSTESITLQPPPVPTTATPGGGSFFLLPWWMVVIILLLAIIGFYESYRRRLTKVLRHQHRELTELGQNLTAPAPPVVLPPAPAQSEPSPAAVVDGASPPIDDANKPAEDQAPALEFTTKTLGIIDGEPQKKPVSRKPRNIVVRKKSALKRTAKKEL